MNVDELAKLLVIERVRIDEYSISGEFRDNSWCLEHKGSGGWLVYYLDHGVMGGTRRFDTEDTACDAFAAQILAEPGNRIGVRVANGQSVPVPRMPPGRVYRSGGFAHVLAFSVSALFLIAMGIGLTVSTPPSPAKWPSFVLILAVFALLIIRAAMVGIWITPTGIVARSWFRTWRFPVGTVRRCERIPYWGLLQGAGESKVSWMLKFSLQDEAVVVVRSTIAPRNTSERQVLEIQGYLNSPSVDV